MHPILFQVTDSFFIGTYGLMIVLGMLSGLGLAAWMGRLRGYPSEVFFDLLFLCVVAGFIGARVMYILTDLPGFLRDPAAYLFARSGFVFLGGLIGGAGAGIAYLRIKKLPIMEMGDLCLPALALAHAFGRLGCHFAGCCFGGRCDLPIGITLPRVEMADGNIWPNVFVEQAEQGLVDWNALGSLPVWPVQLMEATGLFVLTGILALLFVARLRVGIVFGVYLTAYSVLRFALEFLRGDEARGYVIEGVLSTSQGLSLLVLAAGVVVLVMARKNDRWENKPAITPEKEMDEGGTAAERARRRRKGKGSR